MAQPLIDNATLGVLPTANVAEFDITNSRGLMLHVVYDQGTETEMFIKVQFSTIKDDDGNEIWCDWADINQVSGIDHHLIENDPFKIKEGGNYRFPLIPISPREDKIRITVYLGASTTTAGTVSVYVVNDKHINP